MTNPNFTKFSWDVQNWLSINLLKSKLWYSNPFQNASMPNERKSSSDTCHYQLSYAACHRPWASSSASSDRLEASSVYHRSWSVVLLCTADSDSMSIPCSSSWHMSASASPPPASTTYNAVAHSSINYTACVSKKHYWQIEQSINQSIKIDFLSNRNITVYASTQKLVYVPTSPE